jgi:hypothetical protein
VIDLKAPEEDGPMTPSLSSLIVPVLNARVPVELRLDLPLPPGEEPVREPFTGDLYVTYGIDRGFWQASPDGSGGGALERVNRKHCAEAGLVPEALRRQAVANLRARRPDLALTRYPDAPAIAVTLGGDPRSELIPLGLESGLLLDDALMDKLAQDVEGDLVVAVPARPVLVASGTGHPDGLAKLSWVVDQVWATAGNGPLLIRDLLVRRPTGWQFLL